jgi:hypothetical protein
VEWVEEAEHMHAMELVEEAEHMHANMYGNEEVWSGRRRLNTCTLTCTETRKCGVGGGG